MYHSLDFLRGAHKGDDYRVYEGGYYEHDPESRTKPYKHKPLTFHDWFGFTPNLKSERGIRVFALKDPIYAHIFSKGSKGQSR